jgi:hypothetical protein
MSHSSARDDGDGRRLSLSPPARRGGEHVIEKPSSASIVYPTLMRTNYTEWSLVMKVNLQAAGLWDVIEDGDGDYRDDRATIATILHVVQLEMQAALAVKPTSTEAWEAIRQVRVGADWVKEVNTKRLRCEFNDITFKASEIVEDFSLHLNTVARQLCVLGDDITDKELIKKMPHTVPEKLEQW